MGGFLLIIKNKMANRRMFSIKIVGSGDDDMKVLFTKRFVLPFESWVCVIKHWKIHNYIQNDRYAPTQWIKEKAMLEVDKETHKYRLKQSIDTESVQDVSTGKRQVRVELVNNDRKNEIPSFQDGDIKKNPIQCDKSISGKHNMAGGRGSWGGTEQTGRKTKGRKWLKKSKSLRKKS